MIPQKKNKRGKKTSRYQAQTQSVRVDDWKKAQPEEAWQRYKLRDSTKGELVVEILHQRVWLWDKNGPNAHHWHLIVRRGLAIRRKLQTPGSLAQVNFYQRRQNIIKSKQIHSESRKKPPLLAKYLRF